MYQTKRLFALQVYRKWYQQNVCPLIITTAQHHHFYSKMSSGICWKLAESIAPNNIYINGLKTPCGC